MASFGHLLYGETYQRLSVGSRFHPLENRESAGRAVYAGWSTATCTASNRFHHVLAQRPRSVLVAEGSRVQMHRPATITGTAARAVAAPAETDRNPRV